MMATLSFLKHLQGIFNIALKSGTVHHSIIQTLYDSFVMVDGDINQMRLELCLATATGKWLDYWGEFFAVPRKAAEDDGTYAKRIIRQVTRPKTTVPAIKEIIADYLNETYHTDYTKDDVSIREPWKDLSKYSHQGLLSNNTRFFSKDYYCHGVIDISIPESMTPELVDLVRSVKAAGVRVIWSFFNSFEIVTGFSEVNNAYAEYARHILTEVHRNLNTGLTLSSSSSFPILSGKQNIWTNFQTLHFLYATMLDKDTDDSILITFDDLAALLDGYEYIEQLPSIRDTGMRLNNNHGILSQSFTLSGNESEIEWVTRFVTITGAMLQSLRLIDNWLALSHNGELSSADGVLFDSVQTKELLLHVAQAIQDFKRQNTHYYNSLQPPILNGERAQYLVPRHNNWLFDTPTMNQQDFYDLWGIGDESKKTLQDVFNFEQLSKKRYLTFGDVYQPPIVVSDHPFYWTPSLDNPWLWDSEVLTHDDLEDVFKGKLSEHPELFPDVVVVTPIAQVDHETEFRLSDNGHMPDNHVQIEVTETRHPESGFILSQNSVISNRKTEYRTHVTITPHPENSFRLSETGTLSPQPYNLEVTTIVHSEDNFVLSSSVLGDTQQLSGGDIEHLRNWVPNDQFTGYRRLSGDAPEITKTTETITYEELPLKLMSGDKTERVVTYTVVTDGINSPMLSGNESTYIDQISFKETVLTLGTLLEWEDKQSELFSIQHPLQAPIQVTEL